MSFSGVLLISNILFLLCSSSNYFVDDDWVLGIPQPWVPGLCNPRTLKDPSQTFTAFAPDLFTPSFFRYDCGGNGVDKKIFSDETCETETGTTNIPSSTNAGNINSYDCNSVNNYAVFNFYAYIFNQTDLTQACTLNSNPLNGQFTFALDTCVINTPNNIAQMVTCSAGIGTITTYSGSTCDVNNIVDVSSIDDGCSLYLVEEEPNTKILIYVYGSLDSCVVNNNVVTAEPTIVTSMPTDQPSMSPSMKPTDNPSSVTVDPTINPSMTPSITPTKNPVERAGINKINIIYCIFITIISLILIN